MCSSPMHLLTQAKICTSSPKPISKPPHPRYYLLPLVYGNFWPYSPSEFLNLLICSKICASSHAKICAPLPCKFFSPKSALPRPCSYFLPLPYANFCASLPSYYLNLLTYSKIYASSSMLVLDWGYYRGHWDFHQINVYRYILCIKTTPEIFLKMYSP